MKVHSIINYTIFCLRYLLMPFACVDIFFCFYMQVQCENYEYANDQHIQYYKYTILSIDSGSEGTGLT